MYTADRFRRSLIKLRHWEYWPFILINFIPAIYWCWLMIRSRSWFFFSTSNPGIRFSGFLMESKMEIYDLLPENYYPKTVLAGQTDSPEDCLSYLKENKMPFPIVAKPDIGLKGKQVKILRDETDLYTYASNSKVPFLLQELIPYPNEIGLFYYRMPGEETGKITGIVKKEFLYVEGNGISTIEELIRKNDRAFLQLPALQKEGRLNLRHVLAAGEKQILVPYGNHCRGALFLDHSEYITPELEASMNKICRQIPGFYYGRLDLRYENWEDLCQGRHFQIVELNGAGSEPTHIYDPSHSLLFAWKEIIRHEKILYQVSRANRKLNQAGMNFLEGWKMLQDNKKHMRLLA